MFYQPFKNSEYHLNLRLFPILSTAAGLELNTCTYIDTVYPAMAAIFERGFYIWRMSLPEREIPEKRLRRKFYPSDP
jgi:hypothetical protein